VALNEIVGLIEKSERPVLYCGGGIIAGNASEELRRFAEATQIPVTTTIMVSARFPKRIPCRCAGWACHGHGYANWASAANSESGRQGHKVAPGADLLLAFASGLMTVSPARSIIL